jgi:hypothetical protein
MQKPNAGNIYVFRTTPTNEFSAAETGRWAAIKVLGAGSHMTVIAVLDKIWNEPPALADAHNASILREHRFSHTGRQAVFGVNVEGWRRPNLSDLTLAGNTPVSSGEAALAISIMNFEPGSCFSALSGANHAAEGEWRWAHDRQAFSEENERRRKKADEERAIQQERYRTRLSKLTWGQLLAETPFERWTPSPPFPPKDFVLEARDVIHETCRKLETLGSKPKKANVRAVLKSCVQWFNDADERAGGVIETEEREDICVTLQELAFVAGQKALFDEMDNWRTW